MRPGRQAKAARDREETNDVTSRLKLKGSFHQFYTFKCVYRKKKGVLF